MFPWDRVTWWNPIKPNVTTRNVLMVAIYFASLARTGRHCLRGKSNRFILLQKQTIKSYFNIFFEIPINLLKRQGEKLRSVTYKASNEAL